MPRLWLRSAAIAILSLVSIQVATAASCSPAALEGACPASGVRLNELQVVGTHNSYKRAIPPAELAVIRKYSPQDAIELDYGHRPLAQQLDMGMRALELDVVYDPQGGRYAHPMLPQRISQSGGTDPYDATAMAEPGFKVLHVPDVDVRSQCATLVMCLQQIRAWSDAHPRHVPILITMNAKQGKADAPGGVAPLSFDAQAFDALDGEIRSALGADKLITPDMVRGSHKTLREAVLAGGWPILEKARGKFLLALDEGPEVVEVYMRGHASLEGLAMFVNSVGEDAPHAAYFTLNEPIAEAKRIQADVKAGFVVRTRADAGTHEARINDESRRDAAFASGAQYVSTDYPEPRADFGPYAVVLPSHAPARCNPISSTENCAR
ncbi:hypothetical protein FHS83_003134 [Rhizomicrobium palustre]|uniref:Calcium-dependent phosphoinositide phospholipase C n=1 Tax=Rhizomicrobium palustre TaxID=189966 RepID=A0A846N252_9PROT|nr:phosphatidylinositol-specific phospholipase C1-like protein [Rhizomicrobium palustre]NIK89816.1 hypothetical protein [Rhizomicrobium palustre]